MKPMLDPERDLKGATPEKLAAALFRRTKPLPVRAGGEPVVGNQVPVKETPTDQPRNRVPHLRKRS